MPPTQRHRGAFKNSCRALQGALPAKGLRAPWPGAFALRTTALALRTGPARLRPGPRPGLRGLPALCGAPSASCLLVFPWCAVWRGCGSQHFPRVTRAESPLLPSLTIPPPPEKTVPPFLFFPRHPLPFSLMHSTEQPSLQRSPSRGGSPPAWSSPDLRVAVRALRGNRRTCL